jgi:hypothetical protein
MSMSGGIPPVVPNPATQGMAPHLYGTGPAGRPPNPADEQARAELRAEHSRSGVRGFFARLFRRSVP